MGDAWISLMCGVLIAFDLQWVYFDVEAGQQEMHAFRRSLGHGTVWFIAHLPLAASLVVASDGIRGLLSVVYNVNPTGSKEVYFWFAGGGIGVALLMISLIGFAHHSPKNLHIDWKWRVLMRAAVGIGCILLPLADLEEWEHIVTLCGATTFVSVFEAWGSLESRNHRGDNVDLDTQAPAWPQSKEVKSRNQKEYESLTKLLNLMNKLESANHTLTKEEVHEIAETAKNHIKKRAAILVGIEIGKGTEAGQQLEQVNYENTFLHDFQQKIAKTMRMVRTKTEKNLKDFWKPSGSAIDATQGQQQQQQDDDESSDSDDLHAAAQEEDSDSDEQPQQQSNNNTSQVSIVVESVDKD